jgi:hypothetical protein
MVIGHGRDAHATFSTGCEAAGIARTTGRTVGDRPAGGSSHPTVLVTMIFWRRAGPKDFSRGCNGQVIAHDCLRPVGPKDVSRGCSGPSAARAAQPPVTSPRTSQRQCRDRPRGLVWSADGVILWADCACNRVARPTAGSTGVPPVAGGFSGAANAGTTVKV